MECLLVWRLVTLDLVLPAVSSTPASFPITDSHQRDVYCRKPSSRSPWRPLTQIDGTPTFDSSGGQMLNVLQKNYDYFTCMGNFGPHNHKSRSYPFPFVYFFPQTNQQTLTDRPRQWQTKFQKELRHIFEKKIKSVFGCNSWRPNLYSGVYGCLPVFGTKWFYRVIHCISEAIDFTLLLSWCLTKCLM